VHESVFAGAKGVQNTIYVSGLRTLNMLGGEVYGSVYGGSRNSSDGGKIVNAGGTMPAEDAVYRAFVNVTGGTIHQHVYGGGFYGKLYGSVDIYVGKQAILGANNSANANKVMPETIINPLYIHGSVYAGSNWGTFTSGDFGPATTSGYSHIYVDGTGYDNSLNEAGQLQNNYINIGMSLFGAGTSCYAGDLGHKIYVRNYGEVVMGTQVMQVETESGTQTHSVNVVVGATRTLRSIQQADNLVIENSNIRFKGEGDMTQPTNTIKYAVANVSEKMIVTKTSTLTIASVVDYIKSLYSVYYTDESHSLYNRTIDQLIANPVRLTGDAQTLYNTENVVRLEDGYSLFVRYMDGSTQKYGTFKGFFRVVANKDSESFAYSRPKLTPTESGTTQENNDDGGFLSYLAAHNDFQDNGVAGTATFQYPYSNILQRDDRIDYRIWRINFTGEPNTVRPVALTAQGAINATSEDFGSATYTVEMPAYKGDCPQTRIKITAVDFGDHASMVDAGYLNGMTDYLYYNKSDGQTTTHTTQTQPIKDEFALISAHPNTTFGLTIKPSGNLASYGTTPATNNPPAVVSHNSLAQTWVFYCDEPENGSQATSFTLNLTYSKQITVNATLSPVTLMVQRVDCNDKVIDEISVPITITTQTVLGQQIDMKTFAYFGNIVTTPNSDQSYAVKAALPTFTKPASGDFYYFWLDGVTFQPENFEAGASAGTSEAVTHTNPMNENDYQYAMTLQQAVNADGQSGWAEAEDQFSEAYDGAAYLDMTGQNKFIGRSDGRKTASIEFVTHYNSYKDGTQYMPQNGVVGTYTFKIKYAANEAGTTDVHYFNIVVQIIKKTTAEKFYIDGVKGSNTYDGRHPDEAKYNLQGVFDADYAPGDYIIVVNAVTAKNPSNALVWSNQNYNGALVKLYRYSGDHELANSANTYALAPNQGPLVKVETSMEMYGIVLDGIETWNGVEHAVLNPNTKSFSTMAPLVAVQRGDRETGGTLLMDANSQLRDNNNVGVSGGTYNTDHYKDAQGNYIPQPVICGGGAYVDAYSTLAVRGGSIIEKNMVSQTSGSENEGGAVYMDSDANNSKYAAMEVKGLVTINDNLIRLGNKAGDPAYMDNVFMKAIENHIEVRDIAAATSVGVTKNAFHEDGDLKDFTPVAVCLDNSFAQDSLNAIFARHTNFYDDQGIYFQYHNDDNPHGPNTIYFGRTWAGVVRTQPEGFTA
ncbi:MAG: hypothetical protein HUK16_08280, partial [Bacteroidales bacterium]|nr:hypothetical protein [Bacteroidales bacterium]